MIDKNSIAEIIEYFTENGERMVRIRLKGAKGTIVVRAEDIEA